MNILKEVTAFDIPSSLNEQEVNQVASNLHRLATRALMRLAKLVTVSSLGVITKEYPEERRDQLTLRSLMSKQTSHFQCLVSRLSRGENLAFVCDSHAVLENVLIALSLISPFGLNSSEVEASTSTVSIDKVTLYLTFDCKCDAAVSHYSSKVMEYLNNVRLPENACTLQMENLKLKYMSVVKSGLEGKHLIKLLVSMGIPATDSSIIQLWRRKILAATKK